MAGENATLQLTVGKEVMIPEVVEESEDEREKEANSTPTTDVIPADKESEDSQTHKLKKKMGSKSFGEVINILFILTSPSPGSVRIQLRFRDFSRSKTS